jgi:alanyl-tRNA synthetase
MACGKWYSVHDQINNEACVGVFESTAEICKFFGITSKNRISSGIMRGNIITFGKERYVVHVYKEATLKEVRRLMRQRFGERMYKISDDGIYIRQPGQSWQYFSNDYDEAVALAK